MHQSITEDTVTVLVSAFSTGTYYRIVKYFCTYLRKHCLSLQETVVKLKSFADNFSLYTHFLQKILPYQLKRSTLCVFLCEQKWSEGGCTDVYLCSHSSLEEECEAPLCTAALTMKNQEMQGDMKRVTSVFEKLQNYINLLALPSRSTFELFLCLLSQTKSSQKRPELPIERKEKPEVDSYKIWTLYLFYKFMPCVSGVQQDALPQSSTSAVFTQLAAFLHSLHDAIKGEQHCELF